MFPQSLQIRYIYCMHFFLKSFLYFYHSLTCGTQSWMQFSRCGITNTEYRIMMISLNLDIIRIPLSLSAAALHCSLMGNFCPTNTHIFFPHALLQYTFYYLIFISLIFLPKFKTLEFVVLPEGILLIFLCYVHSHSKVVYHSLEF